MSDLSFSLDTAGIPWTPVAIAAVGGAVLVPGHRVLAAIAAGVVAAMVIGRRTKKPCCADCAGATTGAGGAVIVASTQPPLMIDPGPSTMAPSSPGALLAAGKGAII